MQLRPIEVECYAGGRADETPRRIRSGEREHIVARLLAESLEQPLDSNQPTQRRYKVLTEEGLILQIVRFSDGSWSLVS